MWVANRQGRGVRACRHIFNFLKRVACPALVSPIILFSFHVKYGPIGEYVRGTRQLESWRVSITVKLFHAMKNCSAGKKRDEMWAKLVRIPIFSFFTFRTTSERRIHLLNSCSGALPSNKVRTALQRHALNLIYSLFVWFYVSAPVPVGISMLNASYFGTLSVYSCSSAKCKKCWTYMQTVHFSHSAFNEQALSSTRKFLELV